MKFKNFFRTFLFLGLFYLLSVSTVKADGVVVSSQSFPVYQTEQEALVTYSEGKENIVLSIKFSGEASDFGWVIPFPNEVEVSKADISIFRKLREFTQPKKNLLDKLKGERISRYLPTDIFLFTKSNHLNESSVKVIEEKSIGIYDYAVLKAEKANDLKDWMIENDYNLPSTKTLEGDSEVLWSSALPMVKHYIDKDWFFVAVKVNNKYVNSSGVKEQLSSGTVSPLRFTFESGEIVYPMKLTKLLNRSVGVTLYVLSDQRVKVENYNFANCDNKEDCSYFKTQYAGAINREEIVDITSEFNEESWYEPRGNMTITKLQCYSLSSEVINEEVLFESAATNKGINDGGMSFDELLQLPIAFILFISYVVFYPILGFFIQDYVMTNFDSSDFPLSLALLSVALIISIFLTLFTWWRLKKTRNRFKRIILYFLQFPSVCFLSFIITLLINTPFMFLLMNMSNGNDSVLLIIPVIFNVVSSLLVLSAYRMIWEKTFFITFKLRFKLVVRLVNSSLLLAMILALSFFPLWFIHISFEDYIYRDNPFDFFVRIIFCILVYLILFLAYKHFSKKIVSLKRLKRVFISVFKFTLLNLSGGFVALIIITPIVFLLNYLKFSEWIIFINNLLYFLIISNFVVTMEYRYLWRKSSIRRTLANEK